MQASVTSQPLSHVPGETVGIMVMPLCTPLSWLMRHKMSRPLQIIEDKCSNKNSVDIDSVKLNQEKKKFQVEQASENYHMLF